MQVSKTGWNSLLLMMKRFFILKALVQKALIDLNLQINFSNKKFDLIIKTVLALLLIKLAVRALCSKISNLSNSIPALATINFMLQSLKITTRHYLRNYTMHWKFA